MEEEEERDGKKEGGGEEVECVEKEKDKGAVKRL